MNVIEINIFHLIYPIDPNLTRLFIINTGYSDCWKKKIVILNFF